MEANYIVKKIRKIMFVFIIITVLFSTVAAGTCIKDFNILQSKKEDILEYSIRPYNRSFYDSFFPIRDWEKGYDEYQSGIDPYGERGTIAWPLAQYLQSEVLMYKATKDPIYLNRVIDVIDKVLSLRDNEVGRVNEYGESPPVWCSGSRYGYGKSILKNKIGEDVAEVLTYGTWKFDTGVVGELREWNDDTYITILKGSANNTFKVRIRNDRKKFDRTYDKLTLKKEGVILDDNSVRITILKSSYELPIFKEEEHIGNILSPYLVGTGLIFTPIIQLAESIKQENLNDYYQEKANVYIQAAIEALEYHKKDWVDLDTIKNENRKMGYYSGSVRENHNDKTPLPWNQMFELGRTLIGLYNVTNDENYKEQVNKIISYFKENLEYDEKSDLYIWKYWNWAGYSVAESTSYSALDYTFIYEAYKAGIGFTKEEMNIFVNTYRKNIYRDNDTIANRINGTGEFDEKSRFSLATINFLSEWGDDYFFYKPIKWIEELDNDKVYDYSKLIAIARSVYQKKIIDSDFVDITDQRKIGRYRTK